MKPAHPLGLRGFLGQQRGKTRTHKKSPSRGFLLEPGQRPVSEAVTNTESQAGGIGASAFCHAPEVAIATRCDLRVGTVVETNHHSAQIGALGQRIGVGRAIGPKVSIGRALVVV